jgi:GT2 family glycosyltransferase
LKKEAGVIDNTIIFNPVRTDYIERAIDTLYKFTDMENWRVIVIDQTRSGCKVDKRVHLYMKPHRNLGFAKSMNEGIIHGLRWGSKYITCANDDVEFIDKRWWEGTEETFSLYDNVAAVNPESPRIPLWGYGRDHGEYVDLLNYKKEYTNEDYNYLLKGDFTEWKKYGSLFSKGDLPDTFPLQKTGVVDAVAMWCTVFKRKTFEHYGLFDERFYPGGAEDYDYDARVYREGGRILGTTKSWVWHHWGQSKDHQGGIDADIDKEYVWASNSYLWPKEWNNGKNMDPWGKYTDEDGKKKPMKRRPEIAIVDI